MKISELIEQLQNCQNEYGDVEVWISYLTEADPGKHAEFTTEMEIVSVCGSFDGTVNICDWKKKAEGIPTPSAASG